ncbi:L-histidine N(alpha)-methyltransferase [Veillonella sp. VA139]|uniref:class I SAM-dependent methyltransferase n=1 Tax=Veillonella sp. VA139 TaxID=741830 RepID=UPI000F8CB274|nr:L-histidine N(alpha)-methyltransferase [Veillonella sp. VA139]
MIPLHHSVEFQHHLWLDVLPTARTIVDMTCGNGHDTVYLLSHCHKNSHIYAIDIQEEALRRTKEKLLKELPQTIKQVDFILGSHDRVLESLPVSTIDVMVGNLGYLPNADHDIMTQSISTIRALSKGLAKLSVNGLCTIVAYPGTETGRKEAEDLEEYIASMNQKEFHCSMWRPLNQANHPPILYIIRRR